MTMLSRRRFLASTAGFTLALVLPTPFARAQGAPPDLPATPNAFIRVGADDTVTVIIKHLEMGQGPYTGLATLVAEEMDADWSQMRAEAAPADDALYKNLAFGAQGTGGSTAIANSYIQMRKAGAAARAMLVEAAAEEWGVAASEIAVRAGRLSHPGGKEAGFGAFAAAAAERAVPQDPPLKDPSQFVLIGGTGKRLDSAAKSDGTAEFTLDIYREGMLTVVVAHPPAFGATVASYDDARALKVKGVEMVRQIPEGIAVYARNTFAAIKGRDALEIRWDESKAERRSSSAMLEDMAGALAEARVVEESGDKGAIEGAAEVLQADYRFPYLAHAPMEPLDAVIEGEGGPRRALVWLPVPLDRPADRGPDPRPSDGVRQDQRAPRGRLVRAARAGQRASRRRNRPYRAGRRARRRLQAALDPRGRSEGRLLPPDDAPPAACRSRCRGPDRRLGECRREPVDHGRHRARGLHAGRAGSQLLRGIERSALRRGGATHLLGAGGKPGARALVALGRPHAHGLRGRGLPRRGARAGGQGSGAGAARSDDARGGRYRGVLEKVAEIADWQGRTREGRAYGVAVAKSFGTYVAQIVEVENGGALPKVTQVWCAVDCGVAVNPDVIRAQMEGGIGYALSAALYSAITLDGEGRVQQSNFDDYRLLRIHEMPQVHVAILPSTEPPTGVGEPGVPPLAPAVANAWRALTGQPVRQLPFAQLLS